MDISDLKIKTEGIRPSTRSRRGRWPKEIQNLVRELLSTGHSYAELSRASGIAHQTLRTWANPKRPQRQAKSFKQVHIRAQGPSLTLRSQKGVEVVGFSFEQLCELLREGFL